MSNERATSGNDSVSNEAYLEYLARTNETVDVVTTEDIYNQFGVLLIAKGERINHRSAQILNQHKLSDSLDNQISIKNCKSNDDIYQDILTLIQQNPEIREIHQESEFDDALREFCVTHSFHRSLRQKLSVMANQLPYYYNEAIFGAWLSCLIAKEMGQTREECFNALAGGLFHDLGLLFLPEATTQSEKLTDEQWRALQSHTVIGKKIIEETASLPESVALGIFEHHERLDQTGYPTQKPGDKLTILGQIIGCTDLLDHLCHYELKDQNQPLRGAIPYFKIHGNAYRGDVTRVLFNILGRSTKTDDVADQAAFDSLILKIRKVNQYLPDLAKLPKALLGLQEKLKASDTGKTILSSAEIVYEAVSKSGLDTEYMQEWLSEEIAVEEFDLLIETSAMQYELLWLFKRLGWNIEQLLSKNKHTAAEKLVVPILTKFHKALTGLLDKAWLGFES